MGSKKVRDVLVWHVRDFVGLKIKFNHTQALSPKKDCLILLCSIHVI